MARELVAFGSAVPPADGHLEYDTTNSMQAQSFQITGFITPRITAVKIYLKEEGIISDSATVWVEIHSSTTGTSQSAGLSTNIVGTQSDSVSTSTLTGSYAEISFTWAGSGIVAPTGLSPDTTYYLVIYSTLTINSTNYIKVGNNTNVYGSGVAHKISTTNEWSDANAYDFTVTIEGQEDISVSDSDTFLFADATGATVPAYTDYRYYMGSIDGKVYMEHPDYYHDDTNSITCQFLTKVTDKAELYPEAHGMYQTDYIVRLWYIDHTEDASVIVSISIDEGTNWTTNTKNIGTGDGTIKCEDFFFPVHGFTFQYRVSNASTSDNVQFIAMEVFFVIDGEYFKIS